MLLWLQNAVLDYSSQHYSPHEPLTRYVKLPVAHAPGMSGTFSPPPISKGIASQRFRHAQLLFNNHLWCESSNNLYGWNNGCAVYLYNGYIALLKFNCHFSMHVSINIVSPKHTAWCHPNFSGHAMVSLESILKRQYTLLAERMQCKAFGHLHSLLLFYF